MLSLSQAKNLQRGDILIDKLGRRWKVNGRVITWKKDTKRICVPLKYGLYTFDRINTEDFNEFGICTELTKER